MFICYSSSLSFSEPLFCLRLFDNGFCHLLVQMIEQIQFAKTIGVAKIDSLLQEMLLSANNMGQQMSRPSLGTSGVMASGSGQQANGQSPMTAPDSHQWQVSYTRESDGPLIWSHMSAASPPRRPLRSDDRLTPVQSLRPDHVRQREQRQQQQQPVLCVSGSGERGPERYV